jgi:hypothetical protein
MSTVTSASASPMSEAPRVKPNAHPYAIKTTSTGLLSRETTTPSSTSHTPYHYVPSSPSPSPTKPTHSHSRGSRHRYNRSLTQDELPRPLPVPPSPDDDDDDEHDIFQSSRQRAETLPTTSIYDPRQWSPVELASHLASVLDTDSDLPIHEIIAFIKDSDITGRSFVRFDEGVLNAYVYLQLHIGF